jgi:hypothetical protein
VNLRMPSMDESSLVVAPVADVESFEIHKLGDRSVLLVGYVGSETYDRLLEGERPGAALTIYSISWKDYSKLVAVPLDSLNCVRDRWMPRGTPRDPLAAIALDCGIR